MQTKEIVIYTWDACPFCQRALALLNEKGFKYEQIKVDGDEAARDEMSKKTKGNKRSVPQIFIAGESIGGCDDLYALNDAGKLDQLVA